MESSKLMHTLVLDSGPIIRNEPSVSTLLASSHQIVTLPAIINEIRDAATRSRLDTTLRPFLITRDPKPESVKFVQDFSRKTGDLSVLSKPDLHLLALAYEIELERNGGDWRLRRAPGQKALNGPMPQRSTPLSDSTLPTSSQPALDSQQSLSGPGQPEPSSSSPITPDQPSDSSHPAPPENTLKTPCPDASANISPEEQHQSSSTDTPAETPGAAAEAELDSDSDSDGWITPSNLSKHQAKDTGASLSQSTETKMMQVATLTTDFAMQNVLLQINLNLLSPSLHRVRHLKTFIKRCHACFLQVKDMDKQFCPRCGKDTLTKVACSTNSNGEFQIHLKKNMQWNNRGNIYSIPKAVPGSASGKVDGGGRGGWGNQLILTEDQKEYVRAMGVEKRTKQKDLMDEDLLPSILSGDRGRAGGRPKVGAGKNVNSKKRR